MWSSQSARYPRSITPLVERQERDDSGPRGKPRGRRRRRGRQDSRRERIVFDTRVERAAEVKVPQDGALPVVKRLEVEEGHDVLVATRLSVPVPLTIEGADGIFQPVVERASPAHEAETALAFESSWQKATAPGEQVPDVDRYHS